MSLHITVEVREDELQEGAVFDLGAGQVQIQTKGATVIIDAVVMRDMLDSYNREAKRLKIDPVYPEVLPNYPF